jgi:hypothetical protein
VFVAVAVAVFSVYNMCTHWPHLQAQWVGGEVVREDVAWPLQCWVDRGVVEEAKEAGIVARGCALQHLQCKHEILVQCMLALSSQQ